MIRILTVLTLLACCLGAAAAEPPVARMTVQQQQTFDIRTVAARPATEQSSDRFPAQVVVPNNQQRVVSAPVGGLVDTVLVAVGDAVRQGQVVARLQSPDLLGLQRDLLQTRTQLQLARRNLDRDSQLHKDGIIAERRFQETRSTYQELVTRMAQQRQALQLAGMTPAGIDRLEHGQSLSSTIELTAPLTGVVMEQMATAGQRVDAATPIYRIATLKPLWLEIHVPLEHIKGVAIGDRVNIASSPVSGHVITIGREIHPADQGVLLRAEVDEGAERLRPGQFVQVEVTCRCAPGAQPAQFRVPRNTLVRLGDRTVVFVQVPDGFSPLDVTVIEERDADAVIAARLPDAARIAVSGTATLKAMLTGIGNGP